MKILYHHRTMGDGAEGIHIREIVVALRELGHDVRVEALAGDPTQSSATDASPRRLSRLRRFIPGALYEFAELGYNFVGYQRLLRTAGEFRPNVVYDRYNSYSTPALRTARRIGVPLLLEVNAPIAYERNVYEHLPLKFPWLARRYERRIFEGADRIFVVSTPLKQHLVETIGIDPTKIVILPNGADPMRFAPDVDPARVQQQYQLRGRVVIGFVGILRPWHGVDLLLKAFQQLRARSPYVHLLIVGDGPIEEELKGMAQTLGLGGAVTFTGRLTHDEVVSRIAAMDIAVSPQATFYASPMKLLEYMSMGRAVVAPAMDNIRDVVEDGRTGLLFSPNSVEDLTGALQRLAADPELRAQLGAAARRSVIDQFNWRLNAQRVIDEATLLLSRTSKSAADCMLR